MSNPIINYDFTLNGDKDRKTLIECLNELCREWVFQLEEGESGYKHYQGRLKLKTKKRLTTLKNNFPWPEIHLSPTASANIGNNFYVTKEETRIEGPWSSAEEPVKIPWDIAMIKELRPWQNELLKMSKERILREVFIIIDIDGGIGKTTFTRYMGVHGHGRSIPYANEHRDICRMVMDMPESNCYIFDMPRALKKDKLQSLYAGIEMIKGGYAYDDRYKFQERYFDPPVVIVFTNQEPDIRMLSADRWRIYEIVEQELRIRGR